MRLQYGLITFDLPALAAVILLSLLLMRSTRESSTLNIIVVSPSTKPVNMWESSLFNIIVVITSQNVYPHLFMID